MSFGILTITNRDLTGGVFNAATLIEGNNAACFGLNALLIATPSLLSSVLKPALTLLGCPQLSGFNEEAFSKFPGFSELRNGRY